MAFVYDAKNVENNQNGLMLHETDTDICLENDTDMCLKYYYRHNKHLFPLHLTSLEVEGEWR